MIMDEDKNSLRIDHLRRMKNSFNVSLKLEDGKSISLGKRGRIMIVGDVNPLYLL